jgi:hypothetical protein
VSQSGRPVLHPCVVQGQAGLPHCLLVPIIIIFFNVSHCYITYIIQYLNLVLRCVLISMTIFLLHLAPTAREFFRGCDFDS